MTILITILIALLITYVLFTAYPNIWPKRVHSDILFDDKCINLGVIPERLAYAIAVDYAEREDHSMSSRIEPTFVSESREPKWALIITLSRPKEKFELLVVYNLDGTLYQ